VFEGQFGTWQVEDEDRREVFLYRGGLSVCAASFSLAGLALLAAGPESNGALLDGLFAAGSLGFGLSLVMIHIYITPAKRFLQGLFLAGVAGSLFVLASSGGEDGATSVLGSVLEHPSKVWFVGPLFASLTGVGFKEGVCYGKREAFTVAVLTPVLLLSHLTGLADDKFEAVLLLGWIGALSAFAAGKFNQPIHEDIGDKSVFQFMKLSEEEQQQVLRNRDQL